MSEQLRNHWAVCDEDGAILYDDDGRACIYASRELCRQIAREETANSSKRHHAEKVEIK